MDRRPVLAVTIGDPAGIGPEITLKALGEPAVHAAARVVVVGTISILEQAAAVLGWHGRLIRWKPPGQVESDPVRLPVSEVTLPAGSVIIGRVSAPAGRASVAYVERAVELAKAGLVQAIVTAPINKEALRAAGITVPGHTELLAQLFNTQVETMFVVDNLRIFFLTRHVSLREAIERVQRSRVEELIAHARRVLVTFGIPDPCIAVAGLNPHASEHGLFGHEEAAELIPAIEAAQARGWRVQGPVPADVVFHQALRGRYDAVIALYHDQGHIAAKTYSFARTVSVTTGLPVVRTSVDHGTAFDIAGQGIADATSMREALLTAARMSARRNLAPRDR